MAKRMKVDRVTWHVQVNHAVIGALGRCRRGSVRIVLRGRCGTPRAGCCRDRQQREISIASDRHALTTASRICNSSTLPVALNPAAQVRQELRATCRDRCCAEA